MTVKRDDAVVGFTPGPWTVEPYSETDEVFNVVSEYTVRADGIKVANWIAELDAQIDYDSDVDEQLARVRANAHLIAAAPELYHALKALVSAANEPSLNLTFGDSYVDLRAAIRGADAALAKAEGHAQP